MAKQQHKQKLTQSKKPPVSSGSGTFTYLFRNVLIIAVLAFMLFLIDNLNEKQSELPALYKEFQQLRQTGGSQDRMQELYNEIMEIQNDSSYIKKITRGYHWAIHDLALGNLEQINEIKEKVENGQMKPLTLDDKLMYKVGVYPLLKHINETTPKDAVILLPPGDSAISNNGKWNFIYDPEWTEYFIYPRLCVAYNSEAKDSVLAKRVTHVLIIEGKGYEKLKYDVPVEQRVPETLLPIDHPPVNNK